MLFQTVASFSSLYLGTLLLLLGTGLFNTYLGLRLTALNVSELWVGSIIAAYYLGLVLGARSGHKLISRVGHIRAYAVSAAIVTATVLGQSLLDNLWVWLAFRFLVGLAMVTQFMVLESWLNEQTENHMRGTVFAMYMVFSCLGTVLGQLSITLFPEMDYEPLVAAAISSVLCLVPVALTRRLHPTLQSPAPLMFRYYAGRVPMSLMVVFIAGVLTGAFYGLGPVFAVKQGLSSDQAAIFMAVGVAAGLVAQAPLGWLADRMSRPALIRVNALILLAVGIPLWWDAPWPLWVYMAIVAGFGILQFTLYPIGVAFANDNVDPDRRVGLSGIIIMFYGFGACLGPLMAGALMRALGDGMFFVFVSACAGVLVLFVRPQKVTGEHLSEDAPTQFVPIPEVQSAAPLPALDPRIDMESDVSHNPPAEEAPQPAAS